MKNSLIAIALAALVSLEANAANLDVEVLPGTPYVNASDLGFGSAPLPYSQPFRFPIQTFSTGVAGNFEAVDIFVGRRELSGDLHVQIQDISNGTLALNSARNVLDMTVPQASIPTYYDTITPLIHLDFGVQKFLVHKDQAFALILSDINNSGGGNEPFVWYGAFGNTYAGGKSYIVPYLDNGQSFVEFPSSDHDLAFRTYIAAAPVPEPETYAIFLAGLGLLGFIAQRKKLKA